MKSFWLILTLVYPTLQLTWKANFTEQPDNLYEVVYGSNVTIKCRVTSDPESIILWYNFDNQVTGGRLTLVDSAHLKIHNVQFSDGGEYKCVVRHERGDITHGSFAYLKVKRRTVITKYPESQEELFGFALMLNCEASSDEGLDVYKEWFHDERTMDLDKLVLGYLQTSAGLLLRDVTLEHSGVYTCVAKTRLDSVNASAVVTILDIPNPPKLSVNCTEKSAVVTWVPMDSNGAPILNYILKFSDDLDHSNSQQMEFPSEDREHRVDLLPWNNYTFQVTAVNKVGHSKPSDPPKKCINGPNVPYKNPDGVQATGDKPNRLHISWEPMNRKDLQGGPGFFYRVFWKRKDQDVEWSTIDISTPWSSDHYVVDTPPYVPFLMKVEAHNSLGKALKDAEIVMGYSGEDVPKESPKNLRLVQIVNGTAAELSWDPLPLNAVNGQLKGYIFQKWINSDDEMPIEWKMYSNATQAEINIFKPYSENYVKVAVFNGKHEGPYSQEIAFFTPYVGSGKERKEQIVVSVERTKATILCEVSNLSGLLDVTWLHDNVTIEFEKDPRLKKAIDYTLVIRGTKLRDNGHYTCSISDTKLGVASSVAQLIIKELPKPPVLKRVICAKTSVLLNWKPANGTWDPVLHYIILVHSRFTDTNWGNASHKFPPDVLRTEVNLTTWQWYAFQVVAENKYGKSLPTVFPYQKHCVGPKNVPNRNPAKVHGSGIGPGTLLLAWEAISVIDQGGPGFFYRISWKNKELDLDWEMEDTWKEPQFVLTNLSFYTLYTVKVESHNLLGPSGDKVEEFDFYSGQGVLLDPPGGFNIRIIDSTAVLLRWAPVQSEAFRGAFIGYKIEISQEREFIKARVIIVGQNVTSFGVDKLEPLSSYFFRVSAYNGRYYSPTSEVLIFKNPIEKVND